MMYRFLLIASLFFCLLPRVYAAPSYFSTQARVQADIHDAWKPSVTVGCTRVFNVGSFHNGTDVFATDTTITVSGPNNWKWNYSNGSTVTVPADGTYTVHVTTNGATGTAYEEKATVTVSCAQPVTNCQYSSTQARIQEDTTKPWSQHITLPLGSSFNVGSFHNGTGVFATDTTITVSSPMEWMPPITRANGQRIRVWLPGTYRITVTTNNQTGNTCTETASATTSNSWITNWWE